MFSLYHSRLLVSTRITQVRTNLFWMSLRAFFAKQSHHWEIATPQGERLRLAMTGTWVLMSDFFINTFRKLIWSPNSSLLNNLCIDQHS